MKGIKCCAECADYSLKKHKCTRGAKDPGKATDSFYADCPLVDAQPLRCGRWKLGSKADNACVIPSDFEFYCTCCGKEAIHDYDDTQVLSDFCPNCGARMDGGAENG